MSRIVRPTANHLAGIIIPSPKLTLFTDVWRHHKDLELRIDFEEYKKFLQYYPKIRNSLCAGPAFTRLSESAKYDKFVQDICIAQIFEISWANRDGRYATSISYTANDIKMMTIQHLPKKILSKLYSNGTRFYERLSISNKYLLEYSNNTDAGRYNHSLFLRSVNTIGYSIHAETLGRDFLWVLE